MHLTPEQIAQFAEDGYLLLRGALTDADLDPIIAEYEEYIGRRAEELLAVRGGFRLGDWRTRRA